MVKGWASSQCIVYTKGLWLPKVVCMVKGPAILVKKYIRCHRERLNFSPYLIPLGCVPDPKLINLCSSAAANRIKIMFVYCTHIIYIISHKDRIISTCTQGTAAGSEGEGGGGN